MIGENLNEVALRALSPHAVAAYLKAKGWTDQGQWGKFGLLFARERDGKRAEVVVPTKPTILDFERRMTELLQEVAEIEELSPSHLLNDLSVAPFDVLRVRAKEADEYGSVALDVGSSLFSAGRNLLLSAAIQAASPRVRAVIRGRRPDEANAYLERVRLGQTERGSFVLTLLSPYSFDPANQPMLFDGRPFNRRVTECLAAALKGTERALERSVSSGAHAFKEFIAEGVSSNLCASLSALAELGGGADITLSWSPQKPGPGDATLSLQKNTASVLKEAANALAQEEGPQIVELEGTVLGIAERRDQFDGTVTLHVDLDGKPRKVSTKFSGTDRDKVFEAFHGKTDLRMAVKGELTREGRYLFLRNPREFEVIKLDEE